VEVGWLLEPSSQGGCHIACAWQKYRWWDSGMGMGLMTTVLPEPTAIGLERIVLERWKATGHAPFPMGGASAVRVVLP
jgi:hypothetical protein